MLSIFAFLSNKSMFLYLNINKFDAPTLKSHKFSRLLI